MYSVSSRQDRRITLTSCINQLFCFIALISLTALSITQTVTAQTATSYANCSTLPLNPKWVDQAKQLQATTGYSYDWNSTTNRVVLVKWSWGAIELYTGNSSTRFRGESSGTSPRIAVDLTSNDNRLFHYEINSAGTVTTVQTYNTGYGIGYDNFTCISANNLSTNTSTTYTYTNLFPASTSTQNYASVTTYIAPPPPTPCQYNTDIASTDPACVAPPPPPPTPTQNNSAMTAQEFKQIIHDYGAKAASTALAVTIGAYIIHQFRYRGNI